MSLQKKLNLRLNGLCCFMFISFFAFGQTTYFHPISGVENQWHTIDLDENILDKIKTNLSDVRIFSVNAQQDTLEVPYLIERLEDERKIISKAFGIINKSNKGTRHFFTIKVDAQTTINEIVLQFSNQNYNWKVKLEGSHNQKEWFTILSDYRILSIKNQQTDYKFNTLSFPTSNYTYYQISFDSAEEPASISGTIRTVEEIAGRYLNYPAIFSVEQDKEKKESVIHLVLKQRLPISDVELVVDNSFDYQRPLQIEALVDSVKTAKGWRYNYKTIGRSYLSSLGKSSFKTKEVFTNRLKLTVKNYDNPALNITSAKIRGLQYQLVARFDAIGNEHLLSYGNKKSRKPTYDIVNFRSTIPANPKSLTIGKGTVIDRIAPTKNPLFESELWLWGVMLLIIAVLGYFTFAMIKNKAQE